MLKAQGFSVRFIVVVTLIILVLATVLILFTSGFRTGPIERQTAVSECDSRCMLEIKYATGGGTYPRSDSPFCKINLTIKGLGENLKCNNITTCKVNDTCTLICSGTTAKCK